MNGRLLSLLLTVLLISTSITWAAPLGTVTARYVSFLTDGTVTIWGGGRQACPVRGGIHTLNKTADTGQGNLIPNGNVHVACVDLEQAVRGGSRVYDVVLPADTPDPGNHTPRPPGTGMGPERAAFLSELWSRYYDEAITGGVKAEAFAVSVWEIVYEPLPITEGGLWDVTSWDSANQIGFRCEGADTDLANTWLASLSGDEYVNLVALSHPDSQDFVTATDQPLDIPEPTVMALLVTGGCVALMRKRQPLAAASQK